MRSCVGPVNMPPSSAYRVRSSGWFSTRPPTRVRASSTSTERPAAAIARAAVRPARPAPTTMTSPANVPSCPHFGLALADAGVDVACAARATDAAPLKLPGTIDATVRDVEERGRRGLAIPVDLSRPGAPEAMVQHAADAFGRLDILVNNAAITFDGDLALPMKRWDLVMEVNVRAPLLAMRAALPIMKRAGQGRILNISSAAAVLPIRGLLVYGVSKAALERLTTGAAEEAVADRGPL